MRSMPTQSSGRAAMARSPATSGKGFWLGGFTAVRGSETSAQFNGYRQNSRATLRFPWLALPGILAGGACGSKVPTLSPRFALHARPATGCARPRGADPARSEEHKSELQSLRRISYADFCLKQKHTTNQRRLNI